MSTNPPIPTSISSSSSSEPVGISADLSHPSQSNSMKGVDPTLNQSIHTPSTHHPTQSSYTNTDSRGSQVHTLIDSNHTPSVELINSSSPLTPSANSNSILPISAKSFLLNHSNANSNNSISSISSSSSSSSLTWSYEVDLFRWITPELILYIYIYSDSTYEHFHVGPLSAEYLSTNRESCRRFISITTGRDNFWISGGT